MNNQKTDRKIFIEKIDEIDAIDAAEYSGVYAGSSFCADGLPGGSALLEMLRAAGRRGFSFHLVTPYAGESRLKKIVRLIEAFAAEAPGAEVIVNDLGVLDIVAREFTGLTPVAGRVFALQKTDPQVPGLLEDAFDAGELAEKRRMFSGVSINNSLFAGFMRSLGVSRLELQNVPRDIDIQNNDFSCSLHVPYAYVSSTRFCPPLESYAAPGRVPGLYRCRGHCHERYFRIVDPSTGGIFLFRGNTVYAENPVSDPPPAVDRIVFHRLPS